MENGKQYLVQLKQRLACILVSNQEQALIQYGTHLGRDSLSTVLALDLVLDDVVLRDDLINEAQTVEGHAQDDQSYDPIQERAGVRQLYAPSHSQPVATTATTAKVN